MAGTSVSGSSGELRSAATHCVSCGTATDERVIADKMIRTLPENLRFGSKLRIVECKICNLRYLNPMPDLRDLGNIYDYDVYEDSTNNNPVLMEHFLAAMRANRPELQRIMEIGCGTGNFLGWLESQGYYCEGVEFAESAHRKQFNGPMHYGRMEDLDIAPASFDAVLLLNVIEHLADPVAVLGKIHRMLKPGGVLVMRHPNAELFTFGPYRYTVETLKYGIHRVLHARGRKTRFTVLGFQNQHLFYFNRRSVTRLLHQANFGVKSVSTVDPYNRLRMQRALRKGNVPEGIIAAIRHVLGRHGLGPELLTVSIANSAPGA